MSNKILTIVICAYNMENYISDCLESCLIDSIEDLEILVMNDGSTDRTAEIVMEYQNRFPQSIALIDKPNGGWGSNLNMAVKIATGKYFKNLDADDWYDRVNLQKLVDFMRFSEVDLIATTHKECYAEKELDDDQKWGNYCGKEVILNEIEEGILFPIWDIACKTTILQKHNIELPLKLLYTDTLFIFQLLPYVKSAFFMDLLIYNYRMERDGQSTSLESVHKHYKDKLAIVDSMLLAYKTGLPENNLQHVVCRLVYTYSGCMRSILRLQEYADVDGVAILKEYDSRLKKDYRELYVRTNEVKFLRAVRLLNYRFVKTLLKFAK